MPIHRRRTSLQRRKICLTLFFFLPLIFFAVPVHAQMEELKQLYEQAVTAYSQQHYEEALEIYQKIVGVVPQFAPAYNGMALANQAAGGDENKSIEYLKTAISYDPKLAEAYENLGRIYYGRQDIDHAEKYFKEALKVNPKLINAELSMAWIDLLARSKPEAAAFYFKEVLAVSPDPKTYYGLGQAYFASNQRVEALDVITKLHDLGANDLAERLEASMRENPQVNIQTDADNAAGASNQHGLGPLAPTPDQPTGTHVHLRGKLSDY